MKMLNLTDIEKKAYRSTFQDGIWDLFLGATLMIPAVSALLSNHGMPEGLHMTVLILLQAAALAVFIGGKKFITVPRMGFVDFGSERKEKIKKSRIVLLASVVAGAVVFVVAVLAIRNSPADRPKLLNLLALAWPVNAIVVFSLLAYYLDCVRLYAYGALFALPVPLDMAIKKSVGMNLSPVTFAVPAIVMLAIGLVLLASFLRKYPRSTEEADFDEE